ncbi:hypothetical protein [Marinitoga sp. 1155]|uniref:hypothetical protein n=1 Tax=Marinitoga sp. 1155 TaxID=1428448 RepID=UPI000640E854|nr:hypothetical protein [Marinitoga sp. 1155]KLO24168.1 hypothetical protein X274_04845 [Marinitoga sp. 1155]
MKKVVIYAILLMMFVNMIPVNIFADSKVVNVKVLTNDEMKNIIGAGSNNGGGNSGGYTGYRYYSIIDDNSKKIIYKGPETTISPAVENPDYYKKMSFTFTLNETLTHEWEVSGGAEFLKIWKASGGYTHKKNKSKIVSFPVTIPPRHQGYVVKFKEEIEYIVYAKREKWKDGKIIRIDMPSGTRRDKLEVLAPRYVKINY